MRQGLFKKILPHLIAFIVFLIIALIYCKPALEGKVVSQHDVTHWKGAIHQSEVYAETHGGKYPLWTNALFSGMPTFQIGYPANNFIPGYIHKVLTLGLPIPIQFFFLASICFYFLCIVLRVNPYVGIMGALAFAYATYNAVIISVGHDTKMWSIAYMPALLGAVILIYEKKYWIGAALTAIFTCTIIAMNHLQITYYIFLVIAIMTIFYIVNWIKSKDWPHLIKSGGFALAAIIIGIMTNAVALFSTYEYQKKTIRGGSSALADTTNKEARSQTGLDKEYAFSYSMGITEPFVMMIPRMFGGGDKDAHISEEKSNTIEKIRNMPREAQQFLFQDFPYTPYLLRQTEDGELFPITYWGGVGSVSGPAYIGAIICFLAILAMFVLNNKYKWWILTSIVLAIMMSWGGYFEDFNILLYKYLPFYNKFRAPSMILVIPQLLIPVLGVLGLNSIITTNDKKDLFKKLKRGALATAGIFVILLLLYFSFDFLSETNKRILGDNQIAQQPAILQLVKDLIAGIQEDRRSLMMNDILRSFGLIAVVSLFLFLFIRSRIKPLLMFVSLIILILIDLLPIDSIYLNKSNYQDANENSQVFIQNQKDKEILSDTSFYRVFNIAPSTADGDSFSENITSFTYNSIGGYHAAKLITYQDLIEHQLRKRNEKVLDMLNTKYLIQKNQNGQTTAYQERETALGPAWLVKHIQFVINAHEEMNALNNFNPKDTAIVQESYKAAIPFMPQHDSAASIQLIKNDNDIINYTFNSGNNEFAVFSEVYYDAGWKAYIDGKEAPIVKVNYVLRGLAVPAGKHEIEFRFEPPGYIKGRKMTSIFSYVLIALLAFGIFMEWFLRTPSEKSNKKNRTANA